MKHASLRGYILHARQTAKKPLLDKKTYLGKIVLVFKGPIHAGSALFAALLVFTAACGHHTTARVPPPPNKPAPIGWTQTGIASWYGAPYDGHPSASGEIFDTHKLTAAHPTLPFDTWVEVTNLRNGRQVKVRINDRGPFIDGRIIDLSFAAAHTIEMVGPGTVKVKLKVIKAPKN
ncbi:MAG: septal ring lytic transglycosylase RlpA family protein [Bryobacterales bacterium]|nr:septal ring lytic transglycosylase RlpA family protein [Bryobacterales bacterium]